MPLPEENSNCKRVRPDFLVCLLLLLLTLGVYWQLRDHEFINFDDSAYVVKNRHVHTGLTPENIVWAFSFADKGGAYWHPLTWLSHALDCEMYGLRPGMHHTTNLLFHIANILLLFLAFRRMTGAVWQSACVAALFALHPINVDSVAWIAERKNLLSTFFWFLTLLAYGRYVERPAISRYLLVCLTFLMGLLAKPMLVTLPFTLLLLDYWPLGRIEIRNSKSSPRHPFPDKRRRGQVSGIETPDPPVSRLTPHASRLTPHASRLTPHVSRLTFHASRLTPHVSSLFIEKIPLFLLSGISVYLSSSSLQRYDNFITDDKVPMMLRIENALVSYIAYLWKMIWPRNLAAYYPFPGAVPVWQTVGAGLLLAGVSLLAIRSVRRSPWMCMGWLWYLGTLVPVIGLVQAGLWPAMADRWAYVPFVGIFVIIAWGVPDLLPRWRQKKLLLATVATVILSALMAVTWLQTRHWHDSLTFFEHIVKTMPSSAFGFNGLGFEMAKRGKHAEALAYYREAIRIQPDYALAHGNLGYLLLEQGKLEDAIRHLERDLEINPKSGKSQNNLGIARVRQGRPSEAITHFREAIRIRSDYTAAHYNLAQGLREMGNIPEAIAHFQQAISWEPDYADAHYSLANILLDQGRTEEAAQHFQQALAAKPNDLDTLHQLAVIFMNQGNRTAATTHLRKFLLINPLDAGTHNNLGVMLFYEGKNDEALIHFREALRISPDFVQAKVNLEKVEAKLERQPRK